MTDHLSSKITSEENELNISLLQEHRNIKLNISKSLQWQINLVAENNSQLLADQIKYSKFFYEFSLRIEEKLKIISRIKVKIISQVYFFSCISMYFIVFENVITRQEAQ